MVKHSRSWKLPDREFTSEPTVVISKKVLTLGCRTGIARHRLRACNGLLGREDRKKGRAWDECFIIWLHSAASLEDSCRPRQRGMPHTTSCWMLLTGENKAVTANKSKNNNSYKICLYFMLCRRTHAHTFSLSHYDWACQWTFFPVLEAGEHWLTSVWNVLDYIWLKLLIKVPVF